MNENQKYLILGGAAFLWMLMMLVVLYFVGNYELQPQRISNNTFAFKQKSPALIDINTMMPTDRLIPTEFYSSANPYTHRYIKTENSSLHTSNSRLGEGDGENSGFYRGMLWYNSVFNQYERKDWLGR